MIQRIGLVAIMVLAAYFLVMVIMPPQGNPAVNPLARPPAPSTQQSAEQSAAQSTSNQMSKDAETRKLLAELRTIPMSEYAVNLQKYRRLLELHPKDEMYRRKVAFYRQRLAQQRANAGY